MNNSASGGPGTDPVADWKAFAPEKIPTKGGSLEKLPTLFLETLEQLEGEREETSRPASADPSVVKKQCHYPKYLSILELGCGCGELSLALQLRGHSIHGIDVNEDAIERARALAAQTVKLQRQEDRTRVESDNAIAFASELGCSTFEVGNVAAATAGTKHSKRFDFCVLQLLLSVVGGRERRKAALETAHASLKQGGTLYLSCSGVSDDINPAYKRLYHADASDLEEEHGKHSYYSRDDTTDTVLYVTHHFTTSELESLLREAGFGTIRIDQKRETSSRRPDQQAYFLYATAVSN